MSPKSAHFRCLTLHAERLEVDRVWINIDRLLRSLERAGGRATVFVHPLTAIEAGVDLGPKIQSLLRRGHEIAQHTHYYAPRAPGATTKPVDGMDPENVVRCLDRDLRYLRAAGADPRGYVAGGWVISDAALEWLPAHGFTYDASVRSFPLSYRNPRTSAGDRWRNPRVQGGIVRLPTTTPVARTLLRTSAPIPVGPDMYHLAYIHDYDLLRRSGRVAARVLVSRWRSKRWRTASQIAASVSAPEVQSSGESG